MSDTIGEYKKLLEKQLLRAKTELARAEGAIKKIEFKLANAEGFFHSEMKRKGKKVSKIAGAAVAPVEKKTEVPEEKTETQEKKKGFFAGLEDLT